jgi:DNA primase
MSDSNLAAIKSAIDIVALIGESLPLVRTGSRWKALCPFHNDHNPSLEINPERQSFKCWACGAGGDIFTFVQLYDRVEFPEALRMLAAKAGITLETERSARTGTGFAKADLLPVLAWAESTFRAALRDHAEPREYLASRGISAESIDRFALGFAPDRRDWLLSQAERAGFSRDSLEKAGLLAHSVEQSLPQDRFRGRVIFPIRDLQGRTVAFGGRILPSVEARLREADIRAAKYLNSPETAVFQKRRTLYAGELAKSAARATGWVAVVEGYTDVIALHQAGIENVVGTLGTALGEDHLQLLRRIADRVVLVFDGDDAGQTAADRSLELFMGHGIDLRVLTLPPGLDPADWVGQNSAESLQLALDSAADPLDFAITRAAARYDFATAEGARQAATWILKILARLPRSTRAGIDVKVAKALDVLARRLGVPVSDLARNLESLRRDRARHGSAPTSASSTESTEPNAAETPDPRSFDPIDRELVELVLLDPTVVEPLRSQVAASSLRDAPLRAILQAAYDIFAEGLQPTFESITNRLSDTDRSLAAGLVLPFDQGPTPAKGRFHPKDVQPAETALRLSLLLPRFAERHRKQRLRDLKAAMAELDPEKDPQAYQALRREYFQLNPQRQASAPVYPTAAAN